jgi:hypothetical protein
VTSLRLLATNPELQKEYQVWAESRGDFNTRLKDREGEAMKARWQRHYMHGKNVATGGASETHVTKRRLKEPKPPLPGLGG